MCDTCPHAWHIHCLRPPLTRLPPPDTPWQCPACVQRHIPLPTGEPAAIGPKPLTPHAMRRIVVAEKMDGRLVRKWFTNDDGVDELFWGRVTFLGGWARPNWFGVVYSDGDKEQMKLKELEPLLQPDSTEWPDNVAPPPPYELNADQVRRQDAYPYRKTVLPCSI